MDIVRRFAAKRATGQSSGLTKNMIPKPPKTFGDLARLCLIFNELELFLWLQRKFPPGNMIEQQAANSMRERAIVYISDGLNNVRNQFDIFALWTIKYIHAITNIRAFFCPPNHSCCPRRKNSICPTVM